VYYTHSPLDLVARTDGLSAAGVTNSFQTPEIRASCTVYVVYVRCGHTHTHTHTQREREREREREDVRVRARV
jgi:hypothetical protein